MRGAFSDGVCARDRGQRSQPFAPILLSGRWLRSVRGSDLRAGKLDRRVEGVEDLLREWRVREADWGQLYLEFKPATPDVLFVEDLAVTMLIKSPANASTSDPSSAGL
jgi:hypothetical protein